MKNKFLIFGLLLLTSLAFWGCIKDSNPPLPAYIHVESINFVADSATQGTSSSNIQEFWLSVDGQEIGANQPPNTFPVILDEGFLTNTVIIRAGINVNGISNTKAKYPFYAPFETTIDLEPGKIDTFRPVLEYDSAAVIVIVEDFEPTGTVFSDDKDNNPNTYMARQATDVFEGNFSGQIILDSANLDCTVATAVTYSNLQPTATSFPVFLEMDYKTNNPFSIGIIAHYSSGSTQTTYIAGVNARDYWNKIYFDLTEVVFSSGATQFSIIINALKDVNVSQPEIYVDNIKLVHY